MRKLQIYIGLLIIATLLVFFQSCNKPPQTTYIDNTVTQYDTITNYLYNGVDTLYSSVPCDSFIRVIRKNDTVYIRTIKREIQTKLITKRDTIYRTPIVSNTVRKIDNRVTAKGGSIIGNENSMTTKKNNWWWVFLSGMLTWFVIQNVIWKAIKSYFPFLKFIP